MFKVPPPLLGFNNNVRHRGRIFHIQTEDSGVKTPRIVTHLFADGGRIIKTTRTDYAEHVARVDMQTFVRGSMKEQHKAMFTALRLGELDTLLEQVCGPFEQAPADNKARAEALLATAPPPSESVVSVASVVSVVSERVPAAEFETPAISSAFGRGERVVERPERANTLSNPNLRKVTPSLPPLGAVQFDVASLDRLPPRSSSPARPDGTTPLPRKIRSNSPVPPGITPNLSRPSSRFAAAPPKTSASIFGEGAISEQSLDEVILSYLAEDLDGSSE